MALHPIRKSAHEWIERFPGAFLRCDRGSFLYVTNAPQKGFRAPADIIPGFQMALDHGLLRLTPSDDWIEPFMRWAEPQCKDDRLFCDFARFAACAPILEERALWIAGIKAVELGFAAGGRAVYDRGLRQAAAVCLRTKTGGGLLRACAACLALAPDKARSD